MIKLSNISNYLKAIDSGFDYYGLNGFYEMHKEVLRYEGEEWGGELEILNDLDMNEFELLCSVYLKGDKSMMK